MREKMDMNPTAWEGMVLAIKSPLMLAPVMPRIKSFEPSVLPDSPNESFVETRERLRNEINHGKEYLLQVQNELHDQRELLEQWAQYERTCSLQPLDHLVQSVWLKAGVEQFLIGWLERRQKRLRDVSRKIKSSTKPRR